MLGRAKEAERLYGIELLDVIIRQIPLLGRPDRERLQPHDHRAPSRWRRRGAPTARA